MFWIAKTLFIALILLYFVKKSQKMASCQFICVTLQSKTNK